MTQADKKESSIFDIYNIKDQIKTLIVNYIKGLSKSESQSYWKYILVHALYIYHEQKFSQHIGIHLAVTLLGACEIELYSAIDKMNKSCKYIPV